MYKKFMRDRKRQQQDIVYMERRIADETDEEKRKILIAEKELMEEQLDDKRTKLNYGI